MTAAHWHLLLNHLPVIGVLVGTLVLAIAVTRRNEDLTKVSLAILASAAALTIPVYLTGEPAEEIVEHLPGVSESLIKNHEEAAEIAAVTVAVLGTLCLGLLLYARRGRLIPRSAALGALLLSLAATVLLARAAHLGGTIRHPEIRASTAELHGGGHAADRRAARM